MDDITLSLKPGSRSRHTWTPVYLNCKLVGPIEYYVIFARCRHTHRESVYKLILGLTEESFNPARKLVYEANFVRCGELA